MTSLKEFLENPETEPEPEKETTYKIQVRGKGGGMIVGTLEGEEWSSTEWTDIDFYKQMNDFWKDLESSKGIVYSGLNAKEAEETLVIIRDHIGTAGGTEVRAIQGDDVLQDEKLSDKVERARDILLSVGKELDSLCLCQRGFDYSLVPSCICNIAGSDDVLLQWADFLREEGL